MVEISLHGVEARLGDPRVGHATPSAGKLSQANSPQAAMAAASYARPAVASSAYRPKFRVTPPTVILAHHLPRWRHQLTPLNRDDEGLPPGWRGLPILARFCEGVARRKLARRLSRLSSLRWSVSSPGREP